jgi:hypothetical protein
MAIFTESYCKSILENKSSYSFHGVNLNCYDAENPDKIISFANKNYQEIENQAAESIWKDIHYEYGYGKMAHPNKLDSFFKKYPKYQDIIPILQLKKGFIDEDDRLSLYFNIKDEPTDKKRMLNFYIEFSHSGNMRITDIDFDR